MTPLIVGIKMATYDGYPGIEPSFATIAPRTYCSASNAWGEWVLTDSPAEQSAQDKCVKGRPLHVPVTPSNITPTPKRKTLTFKDLEEKEEIIDPKDTCIDNAMIDFGHLGMFCRVQNGNSYNALHASFLMQGCQMQESVNLACETSINTLNNYSVNFSNLNSGLYFCGDGGIRSSPCSFDPLIFMKAQYDNYIKTACERHRYNNDTYNQCVKTGKVQYKNENYVSDVSMRYTSTLQSTPRYNYQSGYCSGNNGGPFSTEMSSCTPLDIFKK